MDAFGHLLFKHGLDGQCELFSHVLDLFFQLLDLLGCLFFPCHQRQKIKIDSLQIRDFMIEVGKVRGGYNVVFHLKMVLLTGKHLFLQIKYKQIYIKL